MRLQTVLLIVALVAIAVFLVRRARSSGSSGYRKRFDSTLPQQHSSYVHTPVIMGGSFDSAGHDAQSTDCTPGSVDAGSGCSDGGGASH